MTQEIIEEKQYDVTDYWPDLKYLPENVVDAFRVISDEISAVKGISTSSIREFVKATQYIVVSVDHQKETEIAVNLLHYVGENINRANYGREKNLSKGGFVALMEEANPELLAIHDSRHPRYKGAYLKNTIS